MLQVYEGMSKGWQRLTNTGNIYSPKGEKYLRNTIFSHEKKCLSLIVQIMPTDELQNQPSMSGSHRVCRKKLYVINVQGVLRDINNKRVK